MNTRGAGERWAFALDIGRTRRLSCSVRTRLDLPDKLMRELKARAAFGGVKLKDHFANIAHAALQRPIFRGAQPNRSPVPVL